ncbi:MAG: hypothetical protein Q7K45_00055 [Nanoarchaeota archaeon]|nr:hypothetical protein [Nanoarchaeota archaeon]
MRWKIFIVTVFLLLLSSFFVSATSTIAVTPVDNEITLAEEASFKVSITNNGNVAQTYTLYGLEVVWNVNPETRRFTLAPKETKITFVNIRALGPFKPSAYSIRLYIDESNGPNAAPSNRYEEVLQIILYPDEPQEYLPALGLSIDFDETINGQEKVPITFNLVNRNPLNLTNLKIRIQSDMPEFVQEQMVHLPPRQEKAVEFIITPNKFQAPREYSLFFVLERMGQLIKIVEKKIEILPVKVPFLVERTDSKMLLKTNTILLVTNEGNVLDTQSVKIPVSLWQSLFTSGGARVERQQGQRSLVWEETLNPAESITLNYTTNYRIPVYVLIITLVLGLFYLYARSPVQLRKSAVATKSGEDGTLSEVKITIEAKNVSGKPMKDVSIIDLVPSIANIEKGLDLGTLKPTDVKHTPKGAKVIWSMAELDAHEHRVITYKIKAKLNILGTFSLPRVSMEYKTPRGRKRKAYSNVFRLG